jgi:hypothetical protein
LRREPIVLALRQRFVADIGETVKIFAILGFLFSTLGIAVREDLRVTFEFALVGIALASTIVLLVHNKKEEAATAIWFGAVASILVSGDVIEMVGRVLLILFGFFCLWLMWYIKPIPAENHAG